MCVGVGVGVCGGEVCGCGCAYYIIFIHSCIDGHLGCFHILTIVSSVTMNIGVHASFRVMFFSSYTPRRGLQGHIMVLFLVL